MRDLYTQLDEINEDESIYTIGDDILDTFCNGNFTQGVDQMREDNIRADDLNEYLEAKATDYCMEYKDLYYGHFSADFWIALGSEKGMR